MEEEIIERDPLTGCPVDCPAEVSWRLANRQAAWKRENAKLLSELNIKLHQ